MAIEMHLLYYIYIYALNLDNIVNIIFQLEFTNFKWNIILQQK
jgi:hypothetical protein